MAEKTLKALAIKSKSNPPGKSEYKWDIIPEIDNFTKNIVIPELGIEKDGTAKVDIGAIVSGMPTVFARANLFRNALDNVTDKSAEVSGLMLFYKSLIDEWRGFIACIALNYKDIKIERLNLQYSDGKNILETENIYEPLGAFGNMLFERKPLWCDQTLSSNEEKIPFIDVITFKDSEVLGSTSPDSLLFTSVSYKIYEKLPFVNVNNGKLIDPLKSELTPEQLTVLQAFAQHIVNKIDVFKTTFSNIETFLSPNYSSIYGNLQDWLKEMDVYADVKGWTKPSQKPGSAPEISVFKAPFSILFNHSTELYGKDGVIYSDMQDGAISFNPSEILLPNTTDILQFRFGSDAERDRNFIANRPLLLLRADVKDSPNYFAYFTLPLTPHALNVFGNNLPALVGINDNSDVKSRLTAVYEVDKNGETLNVKLRIHTQNGTESELNVRYNVGGEVKGKDILLWPNFMSKKWNRYFMYNEIPHNDIYFQATPFIGDINDGYFRIVVDENNEPLYLAKEGTISKLPEKYKASLIIENNAKVADNPYKYEIYESIQPFKGIKFTNKKADNLCGFAIIRYDKSNRIKELPRDLSSDEQTLSDAFLGIDFGSTNSSVAYWSETEKIEKGMVLKNRRVSLLSSDDKNNDERSAVEDEIFFFQNDEISTNSIKSILSLHDYKRISNPSNLLQEQLLEKAAFGGFPCFEKNLPIENSDNNKVSLKFNRAGIAELKHNMKWSNNSLDKSYKKAYLSSLMLHIYAQLFEEGHQPVQIKWSYPSSMSKSLLNQYFEIYNSLKEVNPLVSSKGLIIHSPSDLSDLGIIGGSTWADSAVGGSSWGENLTSSNSESSFGTSASSGWGDNTSSTSLWGDSASSSSTSTSGSWGDSGQENRSKKIIEVKIDEGPIKFDPKQLNDNESLTEACAVANYFLKEYDVKAGQLLMIFDVGGSTTDISVLSEMDTQIGPGKGMIKQNSIKWAAQRMSQATRYSKNFHSVLLRMCEKKKIKIEGLNSGPLKYNENTAPFFFEQLVDRLQGQDFPDFYRLIAAECKELMSVNLYVTGLIMYYAGQLTLKMRKEMLRSEDFSHRIKNRPPQIYIAFAGKGARIFDWFEAVNPKAANDYYTQMFIRGIGGMEIAKTTITPIGNPDPIININAFKKENNSDVKYEVSKGLAIPTYMSKILVPKEKQAIEILGEEGFSVYTSSGEMKNLDFSNSVTPEMMEQLGSYFVSSPEPGKPPCPKFMDFADLFYKATSQMFGFNMSVDEFKAGFNNMNIESFIKQDSDYIEAQKRKVEKQKFDYVAPIFVMEGIKFYEERILKAIKN
jgi:hypothetical protein